ncbi:M48 family metallopeptidase [Chitinophaga lutea]
MTFEGIYTYESPDNAQRCNITVTNKRIEIRLRDAHGNPRDVYWYWENIRREKDAWLHAGLPQQSLYVRDHAFHDWVEKKVAKPRRGPSAAVSVFLVSCVVILGLLAAAYFWLIPYLAGRVADKMPIEYEVRYGEEAYQSLIKGYEVLEPQTEQVNHFFKAMNIPSEYPVRITVVKESQTNAFAVPGGHIVVFSGLLDKMQHPEELAALLAHEYSHVALRHTTRSMMQSLGTFMAVSLIFGDMTGVGAVVVKNANELKNLHYSRSLEREADLNGLKLLQERHISGEGFVQLFGTLGQSGGGAPSEWLSSHPDLENRKTYIQAQFSNSATSLPAPMAAIWKELKADY